MKYILVFCLILMNHFCVAQNNEQKVDALAIDFSEKLIERQITSFFYTKQYCNGNTVVFKNDDGSICMSNGTYYEVYFIWKEDDKVMIKKIDNCGMYFSMPIRNDLVYSFFIDNEEQLRSEKVRGYTVETPENVPVQRSDVYPCFRDYNFILKDDSFVQKYSLFDLTNESKYENIYYEYNNNQKIVELDSMIEDVISAMESSFRRQLN